MYPQWDCAPLGVCTASPTALRLIEHSRDEVNESEQIMSKSALALASLVMAIPAGLACYVCIDSILKHSENMPGIMTGIMWTLVILCGLLALSPIIFLLRKGPSAAPVAAAAAAPAPTEPAKKPAKAASDDDEFGGDDDGEDSEQLFDEEEAVADDDFDDNFDFDEEPEEEAPKKKKKK